MHEPVVSTSGRSCSTVTCTPVLRIMTSSSSRHHSPVIRSLCISASVRMRYSIARLFSSCCIKSMLVFSFECRSPRSVRISRRTVSSSASATYKQVTAFTSRAAHHCNVCTNRSTAIRIFCCNCSITITIALNILLLISI